MLPHRVMTNGRPLNAVRGSRFGLSEVQHRAGDVYHTHEHDLPYLLLVLRGAFREQVGCQMVELTSGGVVVMPAGCVHRDDIDPSGLDVLIVTLEPALGRLTPAWRSFRGGPVSQSMLSLYRAFVDGGTWELLAIEELLHDATLHAASGTPDARADRRVVRTALDILHAASDQPLRFADIAAEAGVSAAYLSRAFRRGLGTTMGTYLRGVRAQRAAAMLASTAATLVDVALATGFADQSHLCRVFGTHYGMTPERYRRLMQRSNSFKTASTRRAILQG